jgi:hypothetical protein
VVFARKHYDRRDRPAIRANSLNNRNPFPIALLKLFGPFTFFCACYHHTGGNLAHYKANFVEIVNILVAYAVFGNNGRNKAKLAPNDLWIFAKGLLIIVRAIPASFELFAAIDETIDLTRFDAWRVACFSQVVCYIFNIRDRRRKFSRI